MFGPPRDRSGPSPLAGQTIPVLTIQKQEPTHEIGPSPPLTVLSIPDHLTHLTHGPEPARLPPLVILFTTPLEFRCSALLF